MIPLPHPLLLPPQFKYLVAKQHHATYWLDGTTATPIITSTPVWLLSNIMQELLLMSTRHISSTKYFVASILALISKTHVPSLHMHMCTKYIVHPRK